MCPAQRRIIIQDINATTKANNVVVTIAAVLYIPKAMVGTPATLCQLLLLVPRK
jgi:hypothetical protein